MFPPMRKSKTLDQVLNDYYDKVFNESTNGLAEWPSGKPGACYRDVLGEVTSEDTWHMKFAELLGAAISRILFESTTTSGPLEDRGVQVRVPIMRRTKGLLALYRRLLAVL